MAVFSCFPEVSGLIISGLMGPSTGERALMTLNDVGCGKAATGANMAQESKFLQFELDGEFYGVDILKVREINGMMDITAVPQTPRFMKGLINLRGKVVPVIDLRLKFGLSEAVYDDRTSILVIEFRSIYGQMQMGIVVDTVSEVISISANDIEPAPNFGNGMKHGYIKGMAKTKGRVVIILDIDLILTDEELTFG